MMLKHYFQRIQNIILALIKGFRVKPRISNINEYMPFCSLTDKSTYKVSHTVDILWYRESSQKTSSDFFSE